MQPQRELGAGNIATGGVAVKDRSLLFPAGCRRILGIQRARVTSCCASDHTHHARKSHPAVPQRSLPMAGSGAHASSSLPARLRSAPPCSGVRALGMPPSAPTPRHARPSLCLDTLAAGMRDVRGSRRRHAVCSASRASGNSGEPLSSAPDEYSPAGDETQSSSGPADGGSRTDSDQNSDSSSPLSSNGGAAASDEGPDDSGSRFSLSDSHEAAAAAASPATASAQEEAEWDRLDGNQLHTALSAAVNAEDYARAQREWFLPVAEPVEQTQLANRSLAKARA